MINSQLFLVQHTWAQKSENQDEQDGFSFENFHNLPAYEFIGCPDSGKTPAFKQ
ncbi:MAG: hypothetical protein KDE66_05405 [Nitrosomonas sp.]|nr:hypothetical protein [Nitrosomonas sp.]